MVRYLFVLVCMSTVMTACSSPLDGELLWQFETKKANEQWIVGDGQRIYLCADDVYCLDIDSGRLLWEFETFGTHSSAPVIEEGRLFFQCGGLYALDAATGDVLWEFWTKNWAAISPAVDGGRVYAPVGGRLFCLDSATGKRLWSVSTGLIKNAPVVIGNRLFYDSAEAIVCLSLPSGKELWRFDMGSDSVQLVSAGEYVLSAGSAGIVRAHEISTGMVQWQFATSVPIQCMRISSAGKALVCAGVLYCLNPFNGELLWKFKQDRFFVADAQVLDTFAVVSGLKQDLLCISINDGTFIRRLQLPEGGRLLSDTKGVVFFTNIPNRVVSHLPLPPF